MEKQCGRIALIGLPNAGKSTLLNALVGEKLAIISPKAHTTRFCVTGIVTKGTAQAIFIDSPGLMTAPQHNLHKQLVHHLEHALDAADIIVHLVDASKKNSAEKQLSALLKNRDKPIWLVLNKVDTVYKPDLLPLIAHYQAQHLYSAFFMISATTGDGVLDVKEALLKALPERDWLYDDDQLSTLPQATLATELTQEQLFLMLNKELPYTTTVLHEKWEDDGTVITLYQQILVETNSQKAIVLGKQGRTIKDIGTNARGEIKALMGRPVRLFLHVKVVENWQDKKEALTDIVMV
jgi:GTPase